MLETIGAAPSELLRNRRLVVRVAACNLGVFMADALTLSVFLRALGLIVASWKTLVALIRASTAATIGPITMGLGIFEVTSTSTLHVISVNT